jgi:uncharacterized repeat protein (TIGR04076 family)
MAKLKVMIKILESSCKKHPVDQELEVHKFCPNLCHEAFYAAYPFVVALQSGGKVEGPDQEMGYLCHKTCPDRERVKMEIRLKEQ